LNQAVRNAGDAISLIQTAEGATNEITDMMQRMRELAIQAVNDTNSNPDRSYLDLEFQQLKQEIVRISDSTEWNGFKVLNGTAGERVGEMPLFKVTSENQFGSVFIDPTTSRTLDGRDGGQQQTLTFAGTATTKGDLIVGGVRVPVEIGEVRWNALVFAGERIAAEVPDGSDDQAFRFAQANCIALVHQHIQTELENMAETAVRTLLECRFSHVERLARKLAACNSDIQSRDFGASGEWINSVYMTCIIAAANLCRAHFHASKKRQQMALQCAQEAVDALRALNVPDTEANRNMFWCVKWMLDIADLLGPYIEDMCT
jgi:hypothetical protein